MTETRVEYAVRYEWRGGVVTVGECADQKTAQRLTGNLASGVIGASVVRRTVTYGEWEPVQ